MSNEFDLNQEGIEDGVEINLEDDDTLDTPAKEGIDPDRVEQMLAEANRKLEKAKELESKYQSQPGPVPAAPSKEELDKMLEIAAKEIGYFKENDEGDIIPDTETVRKVANVAGQVSMAQQKPLLDQIAKLQSKLEDLELAVNDPDYVKFKPNLNEIIENDSVLKGLKGKISDRDLANLAMRMHKRANPQEKKGRVVTPYKPDVTTTITKRKTAKLTKEDLEICRDGGLDPKIYAKQKYGV